MKTANATPGTNTPMPTMVPARDLKDFHLASSWPDIRGWEVVTPAGAAVGVVDRLMVDTTHQPRYLSITKEASADRAFVPVGAVSAAPGQNRIHLSKEAAAAWPKLTALPADPFTLDTEFAVLHALGATVSPDQPRTMSYATPLFDPKGLVERTATPLKN